MYESITWPLAYNVIRRRAQNNTFGWVRKRQDGTLRPHQGWDFAAGVATPAYAIADGKVRFICDHGDYGLQLCVGFNFEGKELFVFYAHLAKVFVNESDKVEINELICLTGESGNAKGMPADDQHLHLEIRTVLRPRRGLEDRLSPLPIFGKCPLKQGIAG